jgi:hypothetical protein
MSSTNALGFIPCVVDATWHQPRDEEKSVARCDKMHPDADKA